MGSGFDIVRTRHYEHLATLGVSRVHHCILYVIARADGIMVGEPAAMLGISKQALHRPLAARLE